MILALSWFWIIEMLNQDQTLKLELTVVTELFSDAKNMFSWYSDKT